MCVMRGSRPPACQRRTVSRFRPNPLFGVDPTNPHPPTNQEDLFSFDSVMVPICSNHHWTLAVINIKDKRFEYYDSLYGSDNHVLNTLRRYVADEHQARAHAAHTAPEEGGGAGGHPSKHRRRICHPPQDKMGVPIDLSTWTDHASIPKQTNNYDCGIFMCRTAEYLVRGRRMDFSQVPTHTRTQPFGKPHTHARARARTHNPLGNRLAQPVA